MAIEIRMPVVTADFRNGTIERWHKSVGDAIDVGDVLFEVSSDKAVIEVKADDEGTLGTIVIEEEGAPVAVGDVVALLLEEGESVADVRVPTSAPRALVSPVARRVAQRLEIDLALIKGRGPRGRILKADVEEAAAKRGTQSTVPTAGSRPERATIVPHSATRRVIAERLVDSKRTTPHYYLNVDCVAGHLLAKRAEANSLSPEGDSSFRISVSDLVVRACALALRDVPRANVRWTDEAMHILHDSDVSLAVATEEGLITPIIREADQKSPVKISRERQEIVARARNGALRPSEFQGGSVTVSNLGMYGVKSFSAILNPPQAMILAVGAIEERAVAFDGVLRAAPVMACTLSVDHRCIDGAIGAEFLQAFKGYIEEPFRLFL